MAISCRLEVETAGLSHHRHLDAQVEAGAGLRQGQVEYEIEADAEIEVAVDEEKTMMPAMAPKRIFSGTSLVASPTMIPTATSVIRKTICQVWESQREPRMRATAELMAATPSGQYLPVEVKDPLGGAFPGEAGRPLYPALRQLPAQGLVGREPCEAAGHGGRGPGDR